MNDKQLTTSSGAPVADDNNSISAGGRGPLTFDNYHLFEKLTHFNRERIPERVVHARGAGAYGTFTLSKSLSQFTRASFLQAVGDQTEVFLRFSTVGGGQDSSDYARDPRGFAVKFYTDEGNYDIVGNNTPVFFLNDAMKFPDFVHSQKKNPRSNLPDAARVWEYWANHPQSLHQMTILMSDRGIPRSWRHMNGYGSHTFSFYNSDGARYWMKWHFKTDQGIECVMNEEASELPSHGAQQDLVDAIDRGNFPSWTVKVQIMTEAQAKTFPVNPFDLTKVWPHDLVPMETVGKLELNRNVDNYFAETEQAAFAPSNFVPGIGPSPDKMLQARLLAYQDAHRYRVGVNHNTLAVNAPKCPVHNYQRDGAMASGQDGRQNFYPNDQQDLPQPEASMAPPPLLLEEAWVQPYSQDEEDYYSQAGDLYRLLSDDEKDRLAVTIAGGLGQASKGAQQRVLGFLEKADPSYAARVGLEIASQQA
ncbi:MAG: catalase [Pseudomonadales bacterium]|nr:catalase [Pseudomonadales bacterium]